MARTGLVATIAAALLLIAPAAASATDRFVATTGSNSANPCTSSAAPCATINQAVTVSATSGDTIHIGPGTYPEAINTSKAISFVGAGSGTVSDATGATVVDGSPTPAFTLGGGGSLSDLRAIGGPTTNATALELNGPSSAPGVSYSIAGVIALGNNCSGCRALEVRSPSFADPSLISLNVVDSSFVSSGMNATTGFVQSANANFARDSFIEQTNPGGGFLMELGTLTFTDGSIGTPAFGGGTEVAVGGHATFSRTRFTGLRLDGSMAAVDTTVDDSLVAASDTAVSVLFGATLNARNSTFVAEGPTATSGADLQASVGGDAIVNSVNSIFRANGNPTPGAAVDVRMANGGSHTSTFTADHSSYSTLQSGGGTATPAGSGFNLTGAPGFVNEAAGNFHLASGSPLIDRGAPALPGELDLDGSARALSANCGAPVPDIGAFELVPAFIPPCAPSPANVAPVLSRVRMTHRRFRVGNPGAARAPRGTRFIYTLSERATVTITIFRKATGRKKGGRCVKPRRGLHKRCTRFVRKRTITVQSPAGRVSIPFSGRIGHRALSPGAYQARLVAANSGGHSKQARLSFTIVKR